MSDDLRRILSAAEKLGFTADHHGHGRHIRLMHENGICVVASSPSDWRARKNELSNMERIAGKRLPRQGAGKFTFKKQAHLDVRKSPTEVKDADTVDDLLARANGIRDSFRRLTGEATRSNAERARQLLGDYEDIREQLAAHHRVIDPIY